MSPSTQRPAGARPGPMAAEAGWFGLTPGQRWTAALSLVLATCLVFFGAPIRHAVSVAQGSPTPLTGVAPPSAAGVPTPAPGPAGPGVGTPLPVVVPAPSPGPVATPPVTEPTHPTAPAVVLAVRSGDDQLADRDDAAVARAMLAGSGVSAKVVVLTGTSADCSALITAGTLVVASTGLPSALNACLAENQVAEVSFDQIRSVRPSVSTRRDVSAVMLDSRPQLHGNVGVVGDPSLTSAITDGIAALRSAGVHVVAVSYVRSGSDGSVDIRQGVSAFAGANVATVLFAAPVQTQNLWVAQEQVLLPGVAHVVGDVEDSISNETYAPALNGAISVTSQRGTWYQASHGATPLQTSCLARFAKAQQFPVPLTSVEQARVFTWCTNLELVRRAVLASAAGVPLVTALTPSIDSPLTSQLGLDAAGIFRPLLLAVVQWQISCHCWQQVHDFGPVT